MTRIYRFRHAPPEYRKPFGRARPAWLLWTDEDELPDLPWERITIAPGPEQGPEGHPGGGFLAIGYDPPRRKPRRARTAPHGRPE